MSTYPTRTRDGLNQNMLPLAVEFAEDASAYSLASDLGEQTLNEIERMRWSPCAFQMRCTLVWLMPISSAIMRTLQCVALAGRSLAVFSMILSLMASAIGFLPGGLVRPLTKPVTPASTK